jgi:YD repeat-containing protein
LLFGPDLQGLLDGRIAYPGGIENTERGSVPVDLPSGGRFKVKNDRERVYRVDDGLGNLTTWTIGESSIERTDPAGAATRYQYDASGRIGSVVDPLGNITSYSYDSRGNLASLTNPTGAVTRYTHDDGRVVSSSSPDGGVTTYTYDSKDRVIVVISAGGTVQYEYGAAGRLVGITVESETTRFLHHSVRRIVAAIRSDGSTMRYSYDGRVGSSAQTTLVASLRRMDMTPWAELQRCHARMGSSSVMVTISRAG